MIQQIKKLLTARPFVAFKIRTSDGREFEVPTSEHAVVSPTNGSVFVLDDNGLFDLVSGLHIVSIRGTESLT